MMTKWLASIGGNATRPEIEVLVYHFVTDRKDEFALSGHTVKTDVFKKQLQYLSEKYTIVSLKKIPDLLCEETGNRPIAAICFDDGYRGNLTEAYPVLSELNIPATMFICSSIIDNKDILWRDKVRYIIQTKLTDEFIDYLKNKDKPVRYRFKRLKKKTFYNWSKDEKSIRDMSIQKDADEFLKIKNIFPESIAKKDDLFLHTSDIRDYTYLDFGNHTHSHPILTLLDYQGQRREIEAVHNLLRLQNISPTSLAVPFAPYNRLTVRICREFGYKMLLTVSGKGPVIKTYPKEGIIALSRRLAPVTFEEFIRVY